MIEKAASVTIKVKGHENLRTYFFWFGLQLWSEVSTHLSWSDL